MELNKIRIILNNDGTINSRYSDFNISINQYATNYEFEVAYLSDIANIRKMEMVFNIKGASQPAKVLSPSIERIKLEDLPEIYSSYKHTLRLTQFETQFYQDELNATLYIYDKDTVISNIHLSFVMNKANYNKLTPANLEDNSSINSVVNSIYDLSKSVQDNTYFKSEMDAIFATKEELPDLTPYYTKDETEEKINEYINDLIDGAPETFDTLKEISDFIKEDISQTNNILVSLSNKAEKGNVYTKLEIDNKENKINTKINEKQNTLVSGSNIKTVNGYSLLGSGDLDLRCDLSNLETKADAQNKLNTARAYTDTKITQLIGAAPEAYDTLKEIADYISSDKSASQSILNSITKNANEIIRVEGVLNSHLDSASISIMELESNVSDLITNLEDTNSELDALRAEVDNKANSNNVYTKAEINERIGVIESVLSQVVYGTSEEEG